MAPATATTPTPTREQVLEASIASQQEELDRLQRQNAMRHRLKQASDRLKSVRAIAAAARQSVAALDTQVQQAFDALVVAVESGHAQNGTLFQLTAAGQRGAEIAATNLKNIVAARFTAKVQLQAHELKLAELEAVERG